MNPVGIFIELNFALVEEEANRRRQLRLRNAQLRDASNPFNISVEHFKKLYRLPQVIVLELIIPAVENYLPRAKRKTYIPVHIRVLTTLHFLAQGSYQTSVGKNLHLPCSQPVVSRIINEVTAVFTNFLLGRFVKFPTNNDNIREVKQGFQDKFNFPNVIGAIDCSHIAIISPLVNDPVQPAVAYLNRKGFYSINVQAICDSDLKLLAVNARYPGATHDAAIWGMSSIGRYLQRKYTEGHLNGWLIGDSGYPLQPWLMTPIPDALPNSPEGIYTERHCSARNVIERCFGVLKQRFRCLLKHRVLHYNHRVAGQIIYTCAILHNICVTHNIEHEENAENNDGNGNVEEYHFNEVGVLFILIQICSCHNLISGNDNHVGLVPMYGRRGIREAQAAPSSRSEACRPFEEGDMVHLEFYSPGWPNPYPNHTDCVKVLEAPRGHLLKLDFREFFDLEPAPDCKFDFLEVRDGAHGYGKLLGQFCGKEFPPMIISTDRYLWLHFRSDENIEYAGFKAVYEYIDRPTSPSFTPELEMCRININGSEGIFSSTDIPEDRRKLVAEYNIALECMWVITVKEGWKIQLSFPVFKLDKPNDCESNFVDVFSDRTDLEGLLKNYCGSIADPLPSRNNTMFVRFFAEPRANNSKFNALFTAYREKKSNEACAEDEYDCEDATCIAKDLKCNGRVNCRFRWDEDECNPSKSALLNSEHIIIIMVIFSLILSGMCFTFFYNCIKKLIRDHHTIQEHIRQSREQQLNVLGHKGLEEAAIAAEAKKVMTDRSLSNSSHSSPSQKFESGGKETTPCYVPGGELLPILIKGNDHRYNGELYGMMPPTREGTYPEREEKYEQFEMCDSACQTRESLFDPPVQQMNHQQTSIVMPHPSPPAPFSTFGYKKEDKYRTEGKIHIEKLPEKQRGPYSIQSTKSAPDVIVTH